MRRLKTLDFVAMWLGDKNLGYVPSEVELCFVDRRLVIETFADTSAFHP